MEDVCRSKRKGGLDLVGIANRNVALLKWHWWFLKEHSLWASIIRGCENHKPKKDRNFWKNEIFLFKEVCSNYTERRSIIGSHKNILTCNDNTRVLILPPQIEVDINHAQLVNNISNTCLKRLLWICLLVDHLILHEASIWLLHSVFTWGFFDEMSIDFNMLCSVMLDWIVCNFSSCLIIII